MLCVRVRAFARVCRPSRVDVCVCVRVCVCLCMCVWSMLAYVCVLLCMYVCLYVCVRACVLMCVCMFCVSASFAVFWSAARVIAFLLSALDSHCPRYPGFGPGKSGA